MRNKELWLVQENHATVKRDLQRKQNWIAESITNLKESAGKVATVFAIRAALWAEKFGRRSGLEFCRSWKNTLGKLEVVFNTGGHSIEFEFWMKGRLNVCPMWLEILKSIAYGVRETL